VLLEPIKDCFGLFQTSQRRAEASLRAVGEVIPTELSKANLLLRSITSLTLPQNFVFFPNALFLISHYDLLLEIFIYTQTKVVLLKESE
jgi:hypothetical protein